MRNAGPMLDALNVVVANTKAIEQAVINQHNAVVSSLHAIAQGGGRNADDAQSRLDAAGGNPLAGYTNTSGPGNVPGSGAVGGAQNTNGGPVPPPSQGGPSSGYSQPTPPAQPGGGGAAPPPAPPGGGGGGGGGGSTPYGTPMPPPNPGAQNGAATLGATNAQLGNQGAANGGQQGGNVGLGMLGVARDAYRIITQVSEDASSYQANTGGMTRWEAAQRLAQEKIYGIGTRARYFNGYTEGDAMQAYSNVWNAGYREKSDGTGLTLDTVLDFQQRSKTNLGMGLQENTQLMNAYIKNDAVATSEGLRELSDALHQVSDAAGAAGVNAVLARQNFMTMFEGLTNAGAGSGATALAAGQASNIARYGRSMQSVDTSSQFDTDFMYRAASMAGMSPGQYQSMMRNDPRGAQRVVDTITTTSIEDLLGPDQVNWIRQRAEKYGGAAGLKRSPAAISALARDWLDAFQPNYDEIIQVLQATTNIQGITPENYGEIVVGYIMGITAGNAMDEAGQGDQGAGSVVKRDAQGNYTNENGGVANAESIDMLADENNRDSGRFDTNADGSRLASDRQAYRDLVKSRGGNTFDPLIEQAMTNTDSDAKVIVNHKSGARLMTLGEAIKHFPESIAAGQVAFVGKDGKASSVKGFQDTTGVSADTSRETIDEFTQDGLTVGKALDDEDPLAKKFNEVVAEQAAVPADTSANKWLVELSKDAMKLLRLVPPKSGTAEEAAAGLPPNASGAMNEGRRQGSGAMGGS